MAYNMKEIIITVSALIICIMLVRRVFRREIGSRFQYALWLLVVLRLMIPVSIPVSSSAGEFMAQLHLPEWDTDDVVEKLERPIQVTINSRNGIYHLLAEDSARMAESAEEESEGAGIFFMTGHLRYSWLDVLGTIWSCGMFLAAVWIIAANVVFSRRLRRERRPLELSEETEERLRAKLPPKIKSMYEGSKIYIAENLASPCLYGLPGHEAVYLTSDLTEDADRLCHVLTHELCHKKHGDSFWGALRGLLVTIYWFHPLVWAAAILSKRDCELACDETALMLLGEEERISYGETLLSIITRKARISDLLCTATTMTGSGKSVKERIGFIAEKPKVLRMAVVLTAVAMAVVFMFVFTRSSEKVRIMVFDKDTDTVTGADMQIPLPESVREVCGQVKEEGNDDIVIYHIESEQEVGRFARMPLRDALQLADEGQTVVPLGDYGDNYLLKAYLGIPLVSEEITMHTYTPAEADVGVIQHEDIFTSDSIDETNAVQGTDSNMQTEHIDMSGTESETEYIVTEENGAAPIPAPEKTDSHMLTLPFEEGQSLEAKDLAEENGEEISVEYLPNEEIVTKAIYPAKEVNIDRLSHGGCYVYVRADYSKAEDRYIDEMERISSELESVAADVIVLSLNGEIREELLDALTKNRTPYVGDNSKTGALISALPVPSTLNYRGEFALQTKSEPYSLRFEYEMTRDSIPQEDLDMIYFNAVMLFYAIGNVDEITMDIKYPISGDSGSSLHVFYREDMEKRYGELAETDYENEQHFRDGLEDLHEKVVVELNN